MKISYMLAPKEIDGTSGFYGQIKIDWDIEIEPIGGLQRTKHRYFDWRLPGASRCAMR
jgi:hypothetical protein